MSIKNRFVPFKKWVINRWHRLSYTGIAKVEFSSVDHVVVTNQFVLIVVGLITFYNIFYLFYDPGLTFPLIVVNSCVALSCLSVLWFNSRGYSLTASSVALGGLILQLTTVSYMLSQDAGVQIYLLAGATLGFLMIPDGKPLVRAVFVVIPTLLFLVAHFFFTADIAMIRFPKNILNGLYVSSIVTFSFVLYVTAHLFKAQIVKSQTKIELQARELEVMANTDILTRLPNRRQLISTLDREMAKGGEYTYVVAIADIDHFKSFNDNFGHDCGDAVLMEVADRFQETVRDSDIVGRWGGEEFIFVFPATNIKTAGPLLERIRKSVIEQPFQIQKTRYPVTISIGATEVSGRMTYEEAVKRADEALYRGKDQGRNCVVLA